MRNHHSSKTYSLFFIFLSNLIYFSCNKSDQAQPVPDISLKTDIFFDVPLGAEGVISTVARSLNSLNNKEPFAAILKQNAGYPQWLFFKVTKNIYSNGKKFDAIFNIPFIKKNVRGTSAIMIVKASGADTTYQMVYPQDYTLFDLAEENSRSDKLSARNFFNVFAGFDYAMFGITDYKINDGRIFGKERSEILLATVNYPEMQTARRRTEPDMTQADYVTICTTTTACVYASARTNESRTGGSCVTSTSCVYVWLGGGTPGIPQSTNPGSGGGGAGVSGSGSVTQIITTPCQRSINGTNSRQGTDPCSTQPWQIINGAGHLCGTYTWKVVGSGLYASLYNVGFSLVNTDGQILQFMFTMPCVQFSTAGGFNGPKADLAWNEAWNQAVDKVTLDANNKGIVDDFRVKQNMKNYINNFLQGEYGSSASFNPTGCSGSIPISKVKYCN